MSFFDDLFGKSVETAGKELESSIAAEFAEYKKNVAQMIERENAALQSAGIPTPRIASEMSYTQKKPEANGKVEVRLVAPRFEIPPHRQFVITESLTATIFNNLEDSESHFLLGGLGDVVSNGEWNGLIWTNREPFDLYEKLQKDPWRSIYCSAAGDFTRILQYENSPFTDIAIHSRGAYLYPLKVVEGISEELASDIHLRIGLFNYATDSHFVNLRDPATCYTPHWELGAQIPEELLLYLPVASSWLLSTACLHVKILPSGAIKPGQMIEFLTSLRGINCFISFELLRKNETVYFQLRFPQAHESEIFSKLNLYFPDFEFLDNYVDEPVTHYKIHWLKKQSMYNSIKSVREFQLDPYAHLASLFDNAAPGELVSYQIMFAPLLDKSAAIFKQTLADSRADYVRDMVEGFGRRLPVWFVSIAMSSTNEQTADHLMESAAGMFDTPDQNFGEPSSSFIDNEFPLFLPMLTSLCDTEELAALAHFPFTELPIERLEKISMKNVQPPEIYTSGSARIGESKARGQIFPVTMPEEVRDRHLYIVGKSGTGKSTLMETLARRDIEAGRGVAVIDPHGDLIQHLLEMIPEERVSDCVLFSPRHFPVSLEILHAESEHEIDLLSDDLITMFRRTSESWGDKMQAILQMAFQTLLRVPGSSFTDITPLLTDESYRSRILSKINHPQLASFWQHRYDMRQAEPILIRMDRLTTSGTLRSVLTQNKNSLNFYDVITESKIFLADLSKGFLGESTSHLLGSIIVSQIQLAAMRQAHLPQEQRIPFSLFVDEVQNFTTSAFSTILSEARKQKLRLTIAHQFVSQLPGDIQKAVFGNVGTMMFFALSPDDLGAARHELGSFEPADVANLPKYHALCRPVTAARDTFAFVTDAPEPPPARNYAQMIIEQTRREYATAATANELRQEPQQQPKTSVIAEGQTNSSESVQNTQLSIDRRRPVAIAQPLSFATNTEKILHFLRQAEYLSQPQIIALTDLQASNASTALKKLVETNQIKSLDDRRPKIYFIGRAANPTTHNLLVRDLFVKINSSNYAIRSVKFNDNLADLNPDLTVEFVAEDDGSSSTPLLAYFELDRGTEGVQELVRKAERYARIPNTPRVGFVFERESDMQLARKTINYPFILYATLDQFTSLRDNAFYAGGDAPANNIQLPFFGS